MKRPFSSVIILCFATSSAYAASTLTSEQTDQTDSSPKQTAPMQFAGAPSQIDDKSMTNSEVVTHSTSSPTNTTDSSLSMDNGKINETANYNSADNNSANNNAPVYLDAPTYLDTPTVSNALVTGNPKTATPIITRPVISSIDDNNQSVQMGIYELDTLTDPNTQINIDNAYAMSVPSVLSLAQAQQVLAQASPKLAADTEAIAASDLRAEASEGLNRPVVSFRAQAQHYKLDNDVDLTSLKTGITDGLDNLGGIPNTPTIPDIPDIPPDISDRIPDNYEIEREDSNVSANLTVLWPVYTAGRTQALTGVLNARADEARADALLDSDELYTTLVERYFTAQLAIIGAYLREDALHTTEETAYMAKRLLEEGFIAEVEYLEAQVALADAQSEAIKARHDANLAMTALQRLLRTPYPIKPTTPLFVSSKPLPNLDYFQDIAIANHPGLEKVDANYEQAKSLRQLSDTRFKPTVSVYGLHQIDDDASWLVGLSASWKLWGGVDSRLQLAAGDAQMRQALLTKIDVTDNIKLLVEKNWQAVENARIRYLSLNSNVTLAEELLRMKQLGLAEGVNTALDVTTAQTKYQKARTEQAAAANEYVQALAALMESCGMPLAFNDYMAAADIRLPQLY